jgi:hypothetical protein
VRVIPKPASTKEITAVSFPGAGALETVIGSVPDSDGFIPVSVTVSEQTNISALRPTITHTGVSITPPGGTPQSAKPFTDSTRNFGGLQTYRVTAEDGSFKDYAVSIHVSGGGSKIITGFVFSLAAGQAVGQINQDTHTIEVKVPHSVDLATPLVPAITYLGQKIAYGATSPAGTLVNTNAAPGQSAAFRDVSRDFSAERFYAVTAADNTTQEYTVNVTKIPEITIQYEGLRDDKFTAESFDQSTGLLTVTISLTGYGAPYDWYVDGVDQPVSGTQNTLVIKTAAFGPGRHQVTASAVKNADGRHYTSQVYFLVQE